LILLWLGLEQDLELCCLAASLTKNTDSLLVGAGEKWQRTLPPKIDQSILNSFVEKYKNSGAIGSCNDYFSRDFLNKNSRFDIGKK
jgi:hypothetical protein